MAITKMKREMEKVRRETTMEDNLLSGVFSGTFHDSGVDYRWRYDSMLFIARARCKRQRIAELTAQYQGDGVMQLSDIRIETQDFPSPPLMTRLWRWLNSWSAAESFRGRGIGTELLKTFLDFCRDHDITEIYGSIVQTSLDANRSLIRWYERHGFVERPPDHRVLRGSVSQVVWIAPDRVTRPEIRD